LKSGGRSSVVGGREREADHRPPITYRRSMVTLVLAVVACGRARDMPEKVELRDSMPVKRAMQDVKAADSMLDTMPGGEMARGDSAAAMRLLKKKM
jgi:hypothetical protein